MSDKEQLRVSILRNTFLKGKPLEVGKTVTLNKDDANDLIGAGKAVIADKITAEQKKQMQAEEAYLKRKGSSEKKNPKLSKSDTDPVPSANGGSDDDELDDEVYTHEELADKTNAELAEIAEAYDIAVKSSFKKDDFIEAILAVQEDKGD